MNPKIPRREIARLTAQAFGAKLEDLCSASRSKRHAQARWAAWRLIKDTRPETSLKELGALLSKDHTSALHGLVRAKELLDINRDFQDRVAAARKLIEEWRPAPLVMVSFEQPAASVAIRAERPPERKSEPPRPKPSVTREDPYAVWQRTTCKESEDLFLSIARREFPHLVRVPQKEAAE